MPPSCVPSLLTILPHRDGRSIREPDWKRTWQTHCQRVLQIKRYTPTKQCKETSPLGAQRTFSSISSDILEGWRVELQKLKQDVDSSGLHNDGVGQYCSESAHSGCHQMAERDILEVESIVNAWLQRRFLGRSCSGGPSEWMIFGTRGLGKSWWSIERHSDRLAGQMARRLEPECVALRVDNGCSLW